jgi:anaerobic magnesium-protoporphyrin IX monomethyl ester cyclase
MAKILFLNPNKWGRGITPIWIASHASVLKSRGHFVELFDCTFYEYWTNNELKFNTKNKQYKESNYFDLVKFSKKNILKDLEKKINDFNPDIIFWSAISSHIHGEGEYVNLQYGYELLSKLKGKNFLLVAGGLQITSSPELAYHNFPNIDYFISGESEFVLLDLANNFLNIEDLRKIDGLSYYDNKYQKFNINKKQKIIECLDIIPKYDYSLFDKQVFYRPYNGKVLKAVDYELSRGCIYTCSYCVETVIQKYYNFIDSTPRGALVKAKNYLRSKSAKRIFEELEYLSNELNINLIRSQDTNFLTIDHKVLLELEELMLKKTLNISIYIETRPEGINEKTVKLLKNLKVDGVGMGVELAGAKFRKDSLNRFVEENKIIKAFKLLRENKIKRTSYNIIGLPDQDETSILETIRFNQLLQPDNVTVAFYTPYHGTPEQVKSFNKRYFTDNEKNLDAQLRTLSKSNLLSVDKLNYYKKNFVRLVRNEKK